MSDPGPRLRTVIIDDDEDIRMLLGLILEQDGRFEVVGDAPDGRAGVSLVKRERPGGVVVDLDMPILPGRDAVLQIRERVPGAVIAVLSAFALVPDSVAGADATFAKATPGSSEHLRDALVDLARQRGLEWPAWERRGTRRR